MMFGSIRRSSARFQKPISTRSTCAPAVCRTSPFGTVFVPSIFSSRAGTFGAMTSTTPFASASRAPKFAASRTIASAASAFLPCSRASSAMYAAASLITFLRRSLPRFSPVAEMGVDDPMFVCGAIASTSAAWPITAPAESALEPGGAT